MCGSVDTSDSFEGLRKRATHKIIVLSFVLSISVVLIVIGLTSRVWIGDLGSLVITQFGAILLGLSISQTFFLFLTLPDIVDKTIFVTHGLDDPKKAVSHISEKRSDQRIALSSIVESMCGKNASPPEDLVENIVSFVDKHSYSGFLRENYKLKIELKRIPDTSALLASARDRYYEAYYTSMYEVLNFCAERRPYRVKLMIDNHDYEGVPHNQSILVTAFGSTRIRIEDNTIIHSKDYLKDLRNRCPEKLEPLVSSEATVFIDLIKDPDPGKTASLDELLTEKIDSGEKLTVQTQWCMYLRKQDLHETSMMYFTKGLTVSLIAPKQVNASFVERYEGTPANAAPTTSGDTTTWVWGTRDFVYPHEGGTVYWHTPRPSATSSRS